MNTDDLTLKKYAMELAAMTLEEKNILISGACTITFEDNGQDFLVWHIKDHYVVGCVPFQADVWLGAEVLSFPKVGIHLRIRTKRGTEMTVKHLLKKVEAFRGDDGSAS